MIHTRVKLPWAMPLAVRLLLQKGEYKLNNNTVYHIDTKQISMKNTRYTIINRIPKHTKSNKNTNRPAFEEMLADIKRGKISRVVVYKLDRISRSIVDFANMMETFQKYNKVDRV